MKKAINKYYNVFWIILFAVIISGCRPHTKIKFHKKIVQIPNLKKAVLGNGINTGVRIIETYPNEDTCKVGEINANLYMCKNVENGDTLYVFSMCDKVPSFAKQDLYEVFVIDHEDIINNPPEKVMVKVPTSYSIPVNAKYVLSNLTRLED